MENKDTKTDYQEVVRVDEQKWEMVEIIHYFLYIYGIFKSHLKKITPPKVSIPIQNPTLTYVPTI